MRIVVVGGYAPSLLSLRGPLLKRLVDLGHEVHALAPLHTPDVGPQLEALGVQYSITPLTPGVFNPFADISSLLHFKQVMHRINPDLVFSYSFKPVVFGSLSARMAWVAHKKRVYAMITGLGYDFIRDSGVLRSLRFAVTKSMYRSGLRACDGVIFQKDEDESLFRTMNLLPDHAETTVINGTGVDLEEYDVAPLPASPSFLCRSELRTSMGVREYAAAALGLKGRYPDTAFRLIGLLTDKDDAIPESEVNAWREAGLEVVGAVEDERAEIARSSVFVWPSHRESAPQPVLRAMAMGRPVIAADAPGCREAIESGENGLLVPFGDEQQLSDAMESLLDNPSHIAAMGGSGRAVVENRFDAQAHNDALLSFMGLI